MEHAYGSATHPELVALLPAATTSAMRAVMQPGEEGNKLREHMQ